MKRLRRKRRVALALFTCIAVVTCAAIASASALTKRSPSHRPPKAVTHASALPALMSHPLLLAKAPGATKASVATAAAAIDALIAKRGSQKIKPFIYLMAVDGNYAYYVKTTRTVSRRELAAEVFLSLPSKLIKVELSTGTETTLLTTSRSLIYSVLANHGRIAVSLLKIASGRKNTTVDSQILTAQHADAALKTSSSNFARISNHGDRVCGGFKLASGFSDQGELLAAAIDADCKADSDVELNMVGISQDGATRTLIEDPGYEALFANRIQLNSNLLFNIGGYGYESELDAKNLETQKVERYWEDGGSFVSDQAADGSVATVPNGDEEYFYDGVFEPQRDSDSAMLVFPQGNADLLNVASNSVGRTFAVKFCGQYLYELRMKGKGSVRSDDPRRTLATQTSPTTETEVILRSATGAYIRTLPESRKFLIQGYGCEGDVLHLVSSTGTKTAIRSFAP